MPETRTFVAVALPPAAVRALEDLMARLRRLPEGQVCRWSAPETIHMTLKFLGDVPDARLPAVYAAVDRAAAGAAPFAFEIRGLGCFPNPRRPNIVWAGLEDPAGRLAPLAAGIDRALAAEGFPRETRPYRPHLTIGRVRRGAHPAEAAALGAVVAGWPDEALAEVAVETVTVFGSRLTPAGPVHTALHASPLAGA